MGNNLNTVPESWKEIHNRKASIGGSVSWWDSGNFPNAEYSFAPEKDNIAPTSSTSWNPQDPIQDKTLSFGEYSLSIDEVYRDIKRLTLSKNPLDLIFKANEIREKFAFFINSLASFISESFSSFDNDSFINELYNDAEYHYVWMELAHPFFRDAHFCSDKFDVVTYTKKDDSGNIQEIPINIDELLGRYHKNMMREDDFLSVKSLIQIVIENYREYKILAKRWRLPCFTSQSSKTFQCKNINIITKERVQNARKKVSELLVNFLYEKENFRASLEQIFDTCNLSHQDREDLRIYTFKEIIDLYYPDVRCIFFDTSLPFIKENTEENAKQILTKYEWLRLKGIKELTIDTIGTEKGEENYKDKNQQYFRHVLNCKNLILELESSILSPILLPVILKIIASAMTLDKKQFYKFSYILLFLFANSYENEYIPLSRFLNELEVYINYNNTRRGLEKLKIGFSLIMLFILFIGLWYFLLPTLVFIPGVILVGIYVKMYFVDDYTYSAGIQYNLGVRLWSTIILAIFGYVWLTNISAYTGYYNDLQKRFTWFGTQIVAQILPPEKIIDSVKHGTASILEWNTKR